MRRRFCAGSWRATRRPDSGAGPGPFYAGRVSREDRLRWDGTYADRPAPGTVVAPAEFAPFTDVFPTTGHGLELACGQGALSVWLARRGVTVRGVDVSPVAVGRARDLARRNGVADRCSFVVADLDDGLPPGDPADVIVCYRFWDPRLIAAITARLAPGGLLAIVALSEVGAGPGRYRVRAGELPAAFPGLQVAAAGEGAGVAWMLATK